MALTQISRFDLPRNVFNVCLEMTDDAIYHKVETLEFTLECSKNFIIYSAPSYLKKTLQNILESCEKRAQRIPFYV